MEILVIFLTLVSVIWLLRKLRQTPPPSMREPAPLTQAESTPKPHPDRGRGLEALIPTDNEDDLLLDMDMDLTDAPPPPPAWSEAELDSLSETPPKKEASIFTPEPVSISNTEIEWASEEALTVLLDAGLFPQYQDPQALSHEIALRCDVQTSPYRIESTTDWHWSYWHSAFRTPMEERHPWLDTFMLLAYGPEAGYALHNALNKGLTTEAFTEFGEACRLLSEGSLQVDSILWQVMDDKTFRLHVGERTATYDITGQSLWTVPLQFIRMLNETLPDPSRRFEALTLLPIYGETLVFYLSREEKEMLEAKRGWQFFDWSTLEGNTA
jgi:hypothetical protein